MNSNFISRLVIQVFGGLFAAIVSGTAIAQVCTPPANKNTNFIGNSYFPGSGTAAAGQKTLTVGTVRALQGGTPPSGSWAQTTTAIAAGDLLFIIQMQDATIVNNDDDTYGDGVAGGFGQGTNNLRNTGRYEFGVVDTVAGGTITLRDNLLYEYNTTGATASTTRRSFQVIRVNQNSNLTLPGNLSVIPWDGATGGVIVFDVAGTLNFNGATVNANAAGFRGGGSFEGANSTSAQPDNFRDTTNNANNFGAMKGEGIAGTPRLIRGTANTAFNGVSSNLTGGDQGYPGTFDRSRGAPGNAGGGGNQHNAGGGGGSNSGQGGKGGFSFAFYSAALNSGQCGATAARTFPASSDQDPAAPNGTYYACGGDGARDVGGSPGGVVAPSADRVILGGGGGAGDNNNASDNGTTPQASGGNGGGLIFVRASAVSGSGTLTANGQAGQPSGRDGAGGGGSGGTIALAIPNPTTPTTLSLTVTAQGGKGGDSGLPLFGNESQGPGGAGGGGSVLKPANVSFTTAPNISGGGEGLNRPVAGVANPYGTQAGGGQLGSIDYQPNNLPNSNACYAPNVSKTTSTPIRVQGQQTTATYTITLTQPTNRFQVSGVNIVDDLPATFNVAAGTNATITYAGGSSGPATLPATGSGTGPFDPVTFGVSGGNATNSFTLTPGSTVTITFTVNLNGATPGTYANSVTVNSRNAESNLPVVSGPATTNVQVIPPPTVSKAFDPVYITPGSTSRLTITLTNPTGTVANLTAPLVDTLPTGVTVAGTPNAATTCSGSGAVTTTTNSVTLPVGRSIPANSTCTVSVDVTSSTAGTATNTIPAGGLQTDRGNSPSAANAPLVVIAPTKTATLQVDPDGSRTPTVGDTIRYTLVYTAPAGAPTVTNFQIFDILPTSVTKLAGAGNGVTVTATGAGTSATEDTAYTGVAPTSSLLQSGATLAAGGTITVTIDATINSNVTPGTNIDNTARATGAGLPPVTGSGTGGGIPTDADGPAVGTPCTTVPCGIPQPQDTPGGTEPTRVTVAPTPRTVTGTVYRDLDKDSTRDAGEPGISGVTVERSEHGRRATHDGGDGCQRQLQLPQPAPRQLPSRGDATHGLRVERERQSRYLHRALERYDADHGSEFR
jgi:fimbrial isopeptide formation D2 family protein